eukprot:5450216-Amphidinium_carterae.1
MGQQCIKKKKKILLASSCQRCGSGVYAACSLLLSSYALTCSPACDLHQREHANCHCQSEVTATTIRSHGSERGNYASTRICTWANVCANTIPAKGTTKRTPKCKTQGQ